MLKVWCLLVFNGLNWEKKFHISGTSDVRDQLIEVQEVEILSIWKYKREKRNIREELKRKKARYACQKKRKGDFFVVFVRARGCLVFVLFCFSCSISLPRPSACFGIKMSGNH